MDQKLQVGVRLKNGAMLLAWKEEKDNVVVLALSTKTWEFATWFMDAEGNCVSGNYFHELLNAVGDFKGRY